MKPRTFSKTAQTTLHINMGGEDDAKRLVKGCNRKDPQKWFLKKNCDNWRGITLLSIPSKILSKVRIQRISDAIDKQLRREQAGFRKGNPASEIFTLRNIIEKCTEWQRQLYINFVDFEKA